MNAFDNRIRYWLKELPVGEVAGNVNRSLERNPRVVVTAPPGSGKSTLLPLVILQGLDEGKILMLEPRRVAARQIASRMADMLGERVGETVGYRIRFETKISDKTRIEVITEGILERLLVDDPTLEGYSAVIFDEFHERNLASDVALALTVEAQRLVRPELRVVIMSATIDAASICRTLDAPLVESAGKMYGVSVIHLDDYDMRESPLAVADCVRRALREQEGDILAFLPGQGEIMRCMDILRDSVPLDVSLLPLYGQLSPEQQQLTLMPSSPGRRKIVLATSIAETSITIEGVTTVVDSGLCRRMEFDPSTSLSRLVTTRVSLDMADQRSGRAGRLSEGVCYRLWSKPAQSRMKEHREPEILSADLSSMILAVAAWGESKPERLQWITPPPRKLLFSGRRLLENLGAVDSCGCITPRGRRLAALPCHPRIAAMLLHADDNKSRILAAEIAAILEERDLVNDENDADITTRLLMLESKRGGRWRRVEEAVGQYCRMVGAYGDSPCPDPFHAGRLIAVAYPERVAMRQEDCRYRMAEGSCVTLGRDDDLASNRFLAVAAAGNRIFLAAPLSEADARALARWHENVSWDSRQGRVAARRELRVGALVLDEVPLEKVSQSDIMEILCEAALKEGRTMFDFNDSYGNMQRRIATLATWHPELQIPDVGVEALLSDAQRWLPLYAGNASSVAELRKIDMSAVVWGLLSYDQQLAADRLVPERFRLPCGRTVRIDYRQGAQAPVISARLQDCFGLLETPRLDDGRHPALMELLSPGFKPVQLTSDMENFWKETYFEVRKELRRRYPRHRWPENPLDPDLVSAAKPHK